MQVEIQNFRCWKKHNVIFNNKGLILINGTSGSGKSSILNSIFFAITGVGTKIVSYGEKKCSVKLTFNEGIIYEITRTKNPGRLTVKLREDENIILEDDEAQKVIDSVYGNYFQQTSYMSQKMIHSFLSLTPSEKMNFFQKFVIDGLNENTSEIDIQTIKKNCKEKISEFKKQSIENKSKISLYENELQIIEKKIFNIIDYNITLSLSDSEKNKTIKDFFKKQKKINYDQSVLKKLRTEQSELISIYNNYTNYIVKEKEYLKQKDQITLDIEEYEIKKIELKNKINSINYKGDNYYDFLKNAKIYYKTQKELNNLNIKLENEKNNLILFVNEQVNFLENEKNKLENKFNNCKEQLLSISNDTDYIINNLDKWKKSFQTLIEYLNFKKDTKNTKNISYEINQELNSVEKIDGKINEIKQNLEELKQLLINKQDQINKLKQEWKLKNQIHKCPKCNVSLRFETSNEKSEQKLKIDQNEPIDPKIYKQTLSKFQDDETEYNNKINEQQKEIFNLESLKIELINYNSKIDNFIKRLSRADTIFLKYLEFDLNYHKDKNDDNKNEINKIQNKMNILNKLLEDNIKYKSDIDDIKIKINELNINNFDIKDNIDYLKKILQNTKNQTVIKFLKSIIQTIKEIKDTNDKNDKNLFQSLNKSELNLNENEIDDELLIQTKLNQELNNCKEQLEQVEIQFIKLNNKINLLNNNLNSVKEFLILNENINDKYKNIEIEINNYYKLEEEYNKYINSTNLYEEWKRLFNEKRIQQYMYDNISNEIVVHEMFLNKINETESISLTKCIDTINYYINDYLEKFFQNDSIIVDIVPFKEKLSKDKKSNIDKNEIKPVIDIKVCYKGEEVELSSLSGGEYDRVSLAIMLAFNHICKSDMILLDESISSLDSDLTNDILEKLKENLSDKRIIVVAHQISTGLFDQVVNTR